MVHALEEVHRVLAPGGTLIDARPDSRVPAYVERRASRGFQRFGKLRTNRLELANDRASDQAIANAIAKGLFRSRRRGRFWHPIPFAGLAELRQYVSEHLRFVHRIEWAVDVPSRRLHATDPFVIRRPVRYEVLESKSRRS